MARITYVKKAQQRYATKPVLDEFGNQLETAVMKNGVQKTTKRGKKVFMKVTEADKTKPLPNYTCGKCGVEIKPGDPYKHVSPKSGPYGGRKLIRCGSCPVWQVWEYSSSLSARLAQISYDFWEAVNNCDNPDDVQAALDDAGAAIEELAGQKRESASNIEDGFGHSTSQSEELESQADELEQWASDVTQADIPELPEPAERYFIEGPDGTRHGDDVGYETEEDARDALTGMIEDLLDDAEDGITEDDYDIVTDTLDEPSEEQLDEWREQLQDALSIIDESPV